MTTQNTNTPTLNNLKIPTKFPIVYFEYPDSDSTKMRDRYVKVVEADSDYIKGYELDTPGSKKDGQFKTYSRTRMTRHGVSLISY